MKNKILLILSIISVLPMFGQIANIPITDTAVLETSDYEMVSDNERCVTKFTINSATSQNGYISFWVYPIQYANNDYLEMPVLVNGYEVGKLSPSSSGWQVMTLKEESSIQFQTGTNTITIIGDAYSFPMVDRIRFASTHSDAQLSAEEYNTYHNYNLSSAVDTDAVIINPILPPITQGYTQVNVGYSFSKMLRIYKNQRIKIHSIADNAHDIDLYPYVCQTPSSWDAEEMKQSLNWVKRAEQYSMTSNKYKASMDVKIPAFGNYYIKVRSSQNGVQQTLDSLVISVIDSVSNVVKSSYLLTDCDASYTYIPTIIPADGNRYRTCLMYSESGLNPTIPEIFIEGAGSTPGRVVKFHKADSFASMDTVESEYYMNTSGIHIVNTNSYTTNGICYIKPTELVDTDTQTYPAIMKSKSIKEETTIEETAISNNILNINPNPIEINGIITISSDEIIESIAVYDINGNLCHNDEYNNHLISTETTDIGITENGIYVIVANIKLANETVITINKKIICR